MALNKYYSVTFGTNLDLSGAWKEYEKFQKQINGKPINFNTDGKGLKETTAGVKDLDQTLTNNLLTFQAANMLLSKTIDILSSMAEQVYELNGAMTEYKKVTDLSGTSLDNYVGKLSKMGREVARTGTEMVEAATEFRKNSYSDADSASLALVSTMYQNVADEAISAGDSASFLIAMMKAFNIEAEKSETIIDAVNAVSNSFAVSSSDLALAIPKVSATLASMGNSMEQTIGLMTAG